MKTPCLVLALVPLASGAEPIFPNSVVSNDIDFIASDDPAVPACLRYLGRGTQEMPGGPTDDLMLPDVHLMEATFDDGSRIGLWLHPSLGPQEDAEALALLLLGPLGRLPALMRQRLSHVVVHPGDRTAFAEHLGHFFVLYRDNMLDRIATHDLEETVFHESVHATLDADWAQSAEWLAAQQADSAFITAYAAEKPEGEDLAESALFAFAQIRHPERLPPEVSDAIETLIPARLAFFKQLFNAPEPDLPKAQRPDDCITSFPDN